MDNGFEEIDCKRIEIYSLEMSCHHVLPSQKTKQNKTIGKCVGVKRGINTKTKTNFVRKGGVTF